jgi:hypothetical protein
MTAAELLALWFFGGVVIAWLWARAKATDTRLSELNRKAKDAALLASIHDGSYRLPADKVQSVWDAIRRADDRHSLSTTADVERLREWRKYRALKSIDHRPTVVIDAENSPANDGFAAHELLLFCCDNREDAA